MSFKLVPFESLGAVSYSPFIVTMALYLASFTTQSEILVDNRDLYRAMRMHKRGICCDAVSVRLSVTFVDHVKTNKHIFEIFSPSSSNTILVFSYQRGCRYSDGNPLTGASNAGGVAEIALLRLFWLNCLLLTLQQARCCQHDRQWC